MKAVICEGYNTFDKLNIKEVPKPKINEDEILIKIMASTVSSGDSAVRKPPNSFVRLIFGLQKPRNSILGTEMAGVIEQKGANVTKFNVGDRVVASTGMKFGGHAEYCRLNQNLAIAKIPTSLSFADAVALPFGGSAALHYLRKMKKETTRKILIYGASGAVGSSSVQLAKYYGFEVTAVCSQSNVSLLYSLGADNVFDYTKKDWKADLEEYDYIFDAVGKTKSKQWKAYLDDNGRFFSIAKGFVKEKTADLELLVQLVNENKLEPVIDKIYTMDQIVEAYQRVESGRKRGNVVLDFSQEERRFKDNR
jgi:NADPH:quinone reductase-like Zn-dependent oxidoreductase